MARPRLVKAGVTLRDQLNKAYPGRDKRSDGWLGDKAHQARKSDHNPDKNGWVHAIDIDENFGPGWKTGATAEEFANQLIKYAREGKDNGRLKYVVYENRIASGTYADKFWTWRKGNWGHTQHIHVSFTNKAQRDGSPFNLPIFNNGMWDGVVPKINNIYAAEKNPKLKNIAAWRLACRLKDLNFYKGDVQKVYHQGYPRKAVENFQKFHGLSGKGSYSQETHDKIFG